MKFLDIILSIGLTLGYVIFTYYTRRAKSFEEFSVGNRNIGSLLLFASISATYIGPGFTMGLTKQGYETGMFYFFIVIGYSLQIVLVGLFIAPQLRKKFTVNTYSIGDVIGGVLTHDNKGLKLFSGIVAFGLILGFSIIMCSAAADMLHYFFNINKVVSIVIFTSLVAIYSFSGGIKASILTDALQFVIFIIILPLLLLIMFLKQNIEIVDLGEKIKTLTSNGFDQHSPLVIAGLILSFTLGELLLPPLIGRILASKNAIVSKRSFLYSGIFLIFWLLIMFLIGIVGSFATNSTGSDITLLELGKKFLPQGMYGIFIIAMIGVIMSSQDSLINYGSTLFTRDVGGIIKPNILKSDINQLFMSKVATIIISIFSATFALYVPSVLEGLLICYTVWVPTILVVLITSIYFKQLSVIGAYLSMSLGLLSSIIWNFTSLKDLFPTVIAGLILSIIGYMLGYLVEIKK